MIRDSNDAGNDGILIVHYNMDDIDLPTLKAYRNRFRSSNPEHLLNDVDDQEFLRHLGGYTKDRATGQEGLTLAGLLMLVGGEGKPRKVVGSVPPFAIGKEIVSRELHQSARDDVVDKQLFARVSEGRQIPPAFGR